MRIRQLMKSHCTPSPVRTARWAPALGVALALAAITAAPAAEAAPVRKKSSSARSARKPAVSSSRSAAKAPAAAPIPAAEIEHLELAPTSAALDGPGAVQRLVVTAYTRDGATRDVTDATAFSVSNPKLLQVKEGAARAIADGDVRVKATYAGKSSVPIEVKITNAASPAVVEFVNDVMPIMAKAGCNSTACHGSPVGKAGFKLSLFGYEPELDHPAITTDAAGRRIDLKSPEKSLLLTKATGQVSHGGGVRFKNDSVEYRTILAWIKNGARGLDEFEARVRSIEVMPANPWMPGAGSKQRLAVTALFSDGTTRDVTQAALFTSNDDAIARVTDQGMISAARPGETAVMVRYLGQVGVSRVAVLPEKKPVRTYRVDQFNYVDKHIQEKLTRLRMVPSVQCDDDQFLRRAMLDVCGIIPTPEQVRAFVQDRSPDKRRKLIDVLLQRPEHIDLWTMKWNDILRNNPRQTRLGTSYYSDWIREQIETNRPYDEWVRDLITAGGKTADIELSMANLPPQLQRRPNAQALVNQINRVGFQPAANYYVVSRDPLDVTAATSQVFMGVRIECARCHNHPFEKWTQTDFYALAGYWNGLRVRAQNQAPGIVTWNEGARPQKHPRTNEVVEPRPLDGVEATVDDSESGRQVVANWMTAPENPYFAKAIVNRLWAHYFGRGIVDPVDDFRITNPASNPELLDALARDLVANKFDLRHIHRVILNSWAYQQSSVPNEYNKNDTANFARYYPKRMMAEQLYDSISQATGVYLMAPGAARRLDAVRRAMKQNKDGSLQAQAMARLVPDGDTQRVMQLPAAPLGAGGNGRRPTSEVAAFLDAFGKPKREVVCECERTADGNLGQALLLMNSEDINRKISAPYGRVQQIVRQGAPPEQAVAEIFLAALSRMPDAAERAEALKLVAGAPDQSEGLQDLLSALLNSREFLFIH